MKLLFAGGLIALGFAIALAAKAHVMRREMRLYRSTRAAMISSTFAQLAKWFAMACVGIGVLLLH